MSVTLEGKLVVALSSRALFDFEEENRVFVDRDDSAYMAVQLDRMEQAAQPGAAFPLVKKLLAFNAEGLRRVEVVILSRNDPVSGLRVFRSAEAAGLPVERGVFTRGRPPYHYLNPLGAHLFLSADDGDVRAALAAGFPAARVYPQSFVDADRHPEEVRIAFDGDAVIFSDESERISQEQGLQAFHDNEIEHAGKPLPGGPFRAFLDQLHRIQSAFPFGQSPIRTALVTARSAPAHKRVILTLREWGVRIDEALFLGGRDKGPFLKTFGADIFFDDSQHNIESARRHVAAGHVPHGIAND